MQQGTIEGEENPINVIHSYGLWDYNQKYVTLDRHSYSTAIITMSLSRFEELDEETQQIFIDCAQEAAEYERAWVADQEADQLAALREAGMQINDSPDLGAFQEAVAPVYEKYGEQFGDYLPRIQEALAQ